MRIEFLVALITCLFISSNAQNTITHIVQKGEDIEFLANSYNTTPDKIREWNNLSANEEIAAGYPLSIHITNEDASAATIPLQNYTVRDNGLTEIIYHIQKGQYKNARKLCDKNLSEYNSGNLYYLRGLCNLQGGKLSKAKEDLQRASESSDLSEAFENDCSQLLENAEQYIKEKKERRSQMWAGILVGVAAVGQATVQQMQQNQQNQQIRQSYGNFSGQSLTDRTSNPNGTLKAGVFDADMNRIFVQTVQKTQQQEMNEYQQFCMYNKKHDGSNFTYEEWQQIRFGNSNQTSSGTYYGDGTYNVGSYGGGSTNTIGASTQKDYSNHRCFKCNQSGTYKCPRCSAPTFGNIIYHDCPNCGQRHQSGSHTCRCNDCGGDGVK